MASSRKELVNAMTSRSVKRKRRMRARLFALALCVVLCGGIAVAGINVYMVRSTAGRILAPEQAAQLGDFDCILVLGALVWPGGRPSHMLEDRCRRGVELYHAGAAPVILMSGDHGQVYYDEVSAMKQYAVDHGVTSSHVFMDHAGFNTYDSMYRARDVFGARRVLIVTQEYHLYRAIYIAQRLGLDAWGVTSNYRAYATQPRNDLREYAARVKAFFTTIIQPRPRFLGDPIPLYADGDVTNDTGVVFEPRVSP